jgi:integrase
LAAKRLLIDIQAGRSVVGTCGELLDDHRAAVKRAVDAGERPARALDDVDAMIVNLKRAFGHMEPDAVRPTHVYQYLHKTRGVEAPVRANREISLFQTIYNDAKGQGIVDRNPCDGVKRNPEVPRDRLITDDELRTLCRLAFKRPAQQHRADKKAPSILTRDSAKRVALAAAIAYLTGKAQGQVLRLQRKALDDEGVGFEKRKHGAATYIRYSRLLRRAIRSSIAMPSRIDSLFVVHTRDGTPYTSQGFKKLWRCLMAEYCAPGAWPDGSPRPAGEHFTFHDLRAKAVTDLEQQGRKSSEVTGHKQQATVARHYDRRRVRTADAVR